MSSPASAPRNAAADRHFSDTILGLPCMMLSCGSSQVMIAQQGAQIISWCDANGRERLYFSEMTGGAKRGDVITATTLPPSIRGGIPICFPQFSGRGPLLKHGFARAMFWQLDSVTHAHGHSTAILTLRDDEQTRAIWPHAFLAQLTVMLEPDRLVVTLSITNNDAAAWSFTGALHTYLQVDEIAKTELTGLQNTRYQDATDNNTEVVERNAGIKIDGELDRVYMQPPASLQLLEDGKPSLFIEQSAFTDSVVWNPGPILAQGLKDFPDDDWHRMLCVEAACAYAPLTVQPGETWIGSQTLTAV